MWGSTHPGFERTKSQAVHPTGEEDYYLELLPFVAVRVWRRKTTNTSFSVPFAETSRTTITLNQQDLSRMRNRLVKQER
jgi:hypothetical protein